MRLKVKIAGVTSEARKSIIMAMKEKRCDQQIMAIKAVNKKNCSFAPQAQSSIGFNSHTRENRKRKFFLAVPYFVFML